MRLLPQSPPSGGLSKPAHWSRALLAVSFSVLTFSVPCLAQSIPMAGPGSYAQNFDTLPTTGTTAWTNNSTVAAWYAQKASTATSLNIVASDGSSNSGQLYSFGTGTNTERALGTVGSSTPGTFAYGVQFQNTSGGNLVINSIAYRGEQWRIGATAAQTVDFSYQISATAITTLEPAVATTPTWTALPIASFTSPVITGTLGALDGNAVGNSVAVSVSSSITVPNGSYVMLRWRDIDHSGSDNGLAVDDVNIAWSAVAPPSLALSLAPSAITEGATSTATITRTGDLTSSLVVDVGSSDTTAATTPATVTILANEASTTFTVTSVNDAIQDGSQPAIITASKVGYTSDVQTITVNDDNSDISALTINEVCAEATADHNGDGVNSTTTDEFIEFVNTSGANLDISGWTVSDNNGVTFTFPVNSVLITGQAAVLFGGGTVPITLGSALAFKAPSGTNLNNTGGDIVAVKNGTTLIARMSFATTVTGQAASFNLNGDTTPGPFVLHSAVTGAVGNVSPGKKVDQTEFITLVPLALVLAPSSISEEAGISTGTVTLPGAGVGPATVYLSSSNLLKATVPATVEILAGQSSADFTITGVGNFEPDGTTNVTITVSTLGYSAAQAVLAVVSDTDPVPPSTLAPGSIAFTVFNADGGDDFGFVALVPIPEGTEIRFTDNEWNGQPLATTGVFNTGEGFLKWTAPAGGVPVGTVVVISDASSIAPYPAIEYDVFQGSPYGTVTGNVNLNGSLETLYAYQGTEMRASGFLSVIASHTGDSVLETGLSASQVVYLPTGARIGAYKGARSTQSSFAGYLALIDDTATNWDTQIALVSPSTDTSTDGVTPDAPFSYDVFSLVAPPAGYGSWATTNGATSDVNADHDNDGVKNGLEYFMGATGSSFTPNPGIVSGKIIWPKDPAFVGSYTVQTSPDLVTWTDASSTLVGNTIEYTPTSGLGKVFLRMQVATP